MYLRQNLQHKVSQYLSTATLVNALFWRKSEKVNITSIAAQLWEKKKKVILVLSSYNCFHAQPALPFRCSSSQQFRVTCRKGAEILWTSAELFCIRRSCAIVWRNHMQVYWGIFRSEAITGHFTWLEAWVNLNKSNSIKTILKASPGMICPDSRQRLLKSSIKTWNCLWSVTLL